MEYYDWNAVLAGVGVGTAACLVCLVGYDIRGFRGEVFPYGVASAAFWVAFNVAPLFAGIISAGLFLLVDQAIFRRFFPDNPCEPQSDDPDGEMAHSNIAWAPDGEFADVIKKRIPKFVLYVILGGLIIFIELLFRMLRIRG